MKKDCQNCKNHVPVVDKYSPCFGCTVAGDGSPSNWEPGEGYTPITNADRIRAMSDEELAEMFGRLGFCEGGVIPKHYCHQQKVCSRECVVRWLKQPAGHFREATEKEDA